MKQQPVHCIHAAWSAVKTFVVPGVLLSVALTACDSHREYRLALNPDEPVAVRQEVVLDNRVAGEVARIDQEGATRFAVLRITDRAARVAMRVGVEREQHGAEICLSSASVKPDAAPLEPGGLIPTRTPLNHAARKTVDRVADLLSSVRDLAADHPLVGIAAGVAAILILFGFLRLCFRRSVCAGLFFWLLVAGENQPAQAGNLGFSRQFLKDEQYQYQARLDRTRAEVALGRDRLASGAVGPAERSLLSAWLGLDAIELQMAGHQQKINALMPNALAYSRQRQIQILSDNFRELQSRHARLRDELNALRASQGPAVTNTWQALALYQDRRQDFLQRFEAKLLSPDDLAADLQKAGLTPRLIVTAALGTDPNSNPKPADAPKPPTIVTQVVTATPKTDLSRLEASTRDITRQLDLLRQQQSNIQADVSAIKTNRPPASRPASRPAFAQAGTTSISEPSSPREPARPPPDTQARKPEKVATTSGIAAVSQGSPPLLAATNTSAATGTTTTPAAKAAHTGTSPLQVASSPAEASGTKSPGHHVAAKVAVPLAITVLLAALLVFGLTTSARQHPARINLAEADTGKSQEIALIGPNDILILDDAPHSVPKELRGGNSAICRDWLGRAVLLAADGTSINGVSCPGKRRLHPGDTVTLVKSAGGQTWLFGGVSSVEPPGLEPQKDPVS